MKVHKAGHRRKWSYEAILAHWKKHHSKRKIETDMGIPRSTVRGALKRMGVPDGTKRV